MVKVLGHKSPDTDSICSAIVFSWVLKQQGIDAKPFRLGGINRETSFVLEKFGVEIPELLESLSSNDEVALVDTTNPEELLDLGESTITHVVDHHKLGGLVTSTPLSVTIRPFASTATVIFKEYIKDTKSIPDDILGLILACIISDTLMFRSPTTTTTDRELAETIAKKINTSIESLADEMFTRKSDLSGFSARDVLLFDSKIFELNIGNTRVSVVETTKPENALVMKAELKLAADELKREENLDEILLFVVDILKEEATFIAFSENAQKEITKTFGAKFDDDTAVLPGIVSRKKQIIPKLS
ncbi:manganese-dependent inorganic pyrophosphatase [Candidatus Dojkabacteria bacterium]|nr:manganese-dependent inorganic pyrophosphatase [Candidatus Dojkabacteria bacterium]